MGFRNKAQKGPCHALKAVFNPPREITGPLSTASGKPHQNRLAGLDAPIVAIFPIQLGMIGTVEH